MNGWQQLGMTGGRAECDRTGLAQGRSSGGWSSSVSWFGWWLYESPHVIK